MLQAIITYTPNHHSIVKETIKAQSKDLLFDQVMSILTELERCSNDNMEVRISIKPVREVAYI